ncbi:MAG: Stp1/IreP family PP2C-type Ser/Thr phosphatase [Candidatus Aminicenantes bacterium]|nr:Stp1/IreP family PP2C-type Ser/Thr phosphatase [Candidatus Aminicenantes bacterium]
MQITAHGDSHIGRIRQTNEDHYIYEHICDEEHLFVVADGMGGHQAGDVASKLGTQSFVASYKRLRKRSISVADALVESLKKANSAILQKARSDPAKKGMGTTFSAAAIHGDRLNVIHVGDSRIYLIRSGAIRRLTTDQTFVAKMVEDGRITEEEARDHPQKNILYMSLGAREEFTPEIISDFHLEEKDILVLCSDGLNTHVTDDVIRAYAESYYPAEAVKGLIRRANENGGMDNITVQVVRLGPLVDLDSTVVLQRPQRQSRFPYLWVAAFVLLAVLLAFLYWGRGNQAGSVLPAEQSRSGNTIGGKTNLHAKTRMLLEPIAISAEVSRLLRSDPHRLVHFSADRIWILAKDRYLLINLKKARDVDRVSFTEGMRPIPNPTDRRWQFRRDKPGTANYIIQQEAGGLPILRLRANDSDQEIDPLSRTVSISGLKSSVMPLFISEHFFVFTDFSQFLVVQSPFKERQSPQLIKCFFGDGMTFPVYSMKIESSGGALLYFVNKDRQLHICRFSLEREPTRRVIPYVFFRLPLGVEYLSGEKVMAYFADGATLLDMNGESRAVALIGQSGKLRIEHVTAAPDEADRVAVTTEGKVFRIRIE